jgi:hypothetical protein
MGKTGEISEGSGQERFVLTRSQLRWLEAHSYRSGAKGSLHVDRFPYERKVTPADDWGAEEVARSKWLHIVTANHLRRARKTIRELRGSVDILQRLCDEKDALIDAYRGSIGRVHPFASVPEHYLGDGYVTCDRAIESASAQRCIVDRPPLNYWYWATAFKYVWRMWSKSEPVTDARKAIDCLEKATGICMAVELDG